MLGKSHQGARAFSREGSTISALMLVHVILLCVSLVVVSWDVSPSFHIAFDGRFALAAALAVASLSCVFYVFAIARFTFGYLLGFYILTVVAGYIWISFFTPLQYDVIVGRWSAALSLIVLLIPALFATKEFRLPHFRLTSRQIDLLVYAMLILAACTVAYASAYGSRLAGLWESELLRSELSYPRWLNYLIIASVSMTLPFSYAWAVLQHRYALAGFALIIGISFYPVTLNKLTLFAPLWLLWLTLLSRFFSSRLCVILSLLIPMLFGLLFKVIDPSDISVPFRLINFRMIAITASTLDHYNHFFSDHPVTHFCQIRIIGTLFNCSLSVQLGDAMAAQYAIGNMNASMLATEGIASVGPYFAPIVAFICGLVIAIGNKASAGLDERFILLSGSIICQVLMNVPISITMLSHGGIVLFALWSISPRNYDKQTGLGQS